MKKIQLCVGVIVLTCASVFAQGTWTFNFGGDASSVDPLENYATQLFDGSGGLIGVVTDDPSLNEWQYVDANTLNVVDTSSVGGSSLQVTLPVPGGSSGNWSSYNTTDPNGDNIGYQLPAPAPGNYAMDFGNQDGAFVPAAVPEPSTNSFLLLTLVAFLARQLLRSTRHCLGGLVRSPCCS